MPPAVIYVLAAWLGIVAGIWTTAAILTFFSRLGLKWWRGWLEDEVLATMKRIETKVESLATTTQEGR